MGCDIHLYVELRDDVQSPWRSAESWVKEEPYDDEDATERWDVDYDSRFYSGRNYDLFAILANVRNGRGFAGVKTGEGFVPIDEPRGLPDDVCEQIKACSDRWGSDGHSHSYFTVAELLAYDWTQTTTLCGVLSGPEFAEWSRWRRRRGEMPESYCGGIGGPSIEHVATEEMERRIAAIDERCGRNWSEAAAAIKQELGRTYAPFEQKQSYHAATARFWSHCIPRLLQIKAATGTAVGPENVRIVFWFDN